MKIIRTVVKILSSLVYICIAAYLLIAAPIVLGHHPVVVLSGSMEPTYPVGSVIYYKQAPFEEINVGDPITFKSGGVFVTHRVVEKDASAREFVTEGDANGSRDPGTVSYQNVAGKASKICLPFAGYLIDMGKKPILIVIMAGIILLDIILGSSNKKKKSQN